MQTENNTLFIPPFRHCIDKEEIKEIIDTLESDWITTGPKTLAFEKNFADYVGSKYAIAVNSCTAALHLSLDSIGISKGDEVITSPLTFAATTETVIHLNAKPVLVDIEKETYNLDISKIEEKINENTKAIIPVHYAGHPCEMEEIIKIANEYDLSIIEDAAHAIGASYKDKKIGNIGDLTCFSFYATKNLTTAEGGMITTNNHELAEKVRIMSLHGISKDAWKRYSSEGSWYYEIMYPGYKYNMTDLQASIGIHQLKKLDKMQLRRQRIANTYKTAFRDIKELIIPFTNKNVEHAWHLYPLLIRPEMLKITRNEFIEILKEKNIGTSVHFIPIHLHPYYKNKFGYKYGDFKNCEYVFEREISIPLYPKMTDDEVDRVIKGILETINENKL